MIRFQLFHVVLILHYFNHAEKSMMWLKYIHISLQPLDIMYPLKILLPGIFYDFMVRINTPRQFLLVLDN